MIPGRQLRHESKEGFTLRQANRRATRETMARMVLDALDVVRCSPVQERTIPLGAYFEATIRRKKEPDVEAGHALRQEIQRAV